MHLWKENGKLIKWVLFKFHGFFYGLANHRKDHCSRSCFPPSLSLLPSLFFLFHPLCQPNMLRQPFSIQVLKEIVNTEPKITTEPHGKVQRDVTKPQS